MVFQGMSVPSSKVIWKVIWLWPLVATIGMSFLALWPQIDLWIYRGVEWNGAYAVVNYDEEIYAAYVNGLVLGRPRLSDPLIELQPDDPAPESFFSIQFVQPFFLSTAARSLGITTSSIFIILLPLVAALSTLSLILVVFVISRDIRLASAGAVFTLCFGTLAGWGGKALALLHFDIAHSGLPFLRRYQPGLAFPLFFVFVFLVWLAFTRRDRVGKVAAYLAAVAFSLLVFSYFYLWTAAAAWFSIVVLLWLLFRRSEWLDLLRRLSPLALGGIVTLIAYSILLRDIAQNTVSTQALEFTHKPDLFRIPELIGFGVIFLLWFSLRIHGRRWSEPAIIFILSFALMPVLLFNQQVITGRSLQPFHYEQVVGNYVVLLALLLVVFVIFYRSGTEGRPARFLAILGIISFVWGAVEINYNTRRRHEDNWARDEFVLAARWLQQKATADGKDINQREVVFSPDIHIAADYLPSFAPQALLWSSHAPLMPTISDAERSKRFFLYLYFSDVSPQELGERLRKNRPVEMYSLFGWERHHPIFTQDFRPVTEAEILEQVLRYEQFIVSIDRFMALRPVLSWVVISSDFPVALENIDRWYTRESENNVGGFRLIRVKPRNGPNLNDINSNKNRFDVRPSKFG